MDPFAAKYYSEIKRLTDASEATGKNSKKTAFHEGIRAGAVLMKKRTASGHKLIFIGNGASAAISSHQAADYLKNGGMKAIAFNDAALLTCVSNDLGYEHVFEKPVAMLADQGDVLVAISSSGKSENILKAVKAAKVKGCTVVTLSGFSPKNPLRRMGELNFYVPSAYYGHVEILHHSICHCILELIIEELSSPTRKRR
ncbi:MAG: phosphoheptose isomerase [Elusimicrobia bacterium RIFOXYA2_FULL_58_8]|nr:MAG: phosphoheptose isomerase [Elusimicrobia bacterium RIFOXYA12_FULL_57_11]OGS16145.1 MAG: phosphoheptose isomerase [Elusimicrobia bacterium RIFOXYA2_FULL_58_8]